MPEESAMRQAYFASSNQTLQYHTEQCVGLELDRVLAAFDTAIEAAKGPK